MATRTVRVPANQVRDYNVAQGTSHPSDLTHQIIRDYNIRYVTVENSSTEPIGVAITGSQLMEQTPPVNFTLAGGEIRHIGINTIGSPMQFIHIIDLETRRHVGDPYPFRTDANQFVLRDGINKWFVQAFKRPSYRAAF